MDQNGKLERSTPAREGVSSAAISGFIKAVEDQEVQLNSLMVLRNGKVVAEGWYEPYAPSIPHAMHSFTKGLTATAIGLLAEEGRVHTDDLVKDFFPDKLPAAPSAALETLSVRHLLTMTSGQDDPVPLEGESDYVRAFLAHPFSSKPGSHFYYNSMCSYMLCAILKQVTGQVLTQYLYYRIFKPLGIGPVFCHTCPMGVENGGGGSYLKTEDMAKFSQLYLNKGVWDGRQILPEQWTEAVSSVQFADSYDHMFPYKEDWKHGYGYQTWACRYPGIYRFDGSFGQFGIVVPEKNAVIVTTASEAKPEKILELCWQYLLPAFDGATPGCDGALKDELRSLRLKWPAAGEEDSRETELPEGEYWFSPNTDSFTPQKLRQMRVPYPWILEKRTGIQWMSFRFDGKKAWLLYREDGLDNRIPLGRNGRLEPGLIKSAMWDLPVVSSCARVDGILNIDIRYITTAFHIHCEVRFGGEDAELTIFEGPYDDRIDSPSIRTFRLKRRS